MKLISYIMLMFCLNTFCTNAQSWQWAQRAITPGDDGGGAVVVNKNGGIYATHWFKGNISMGGYYSEGTGRTAYLASFDGEGNVGNVTRMEPDDINFEPGFLASGIATDNEGYIYLPGTSYGFYSNGTYYPSPSGPVLIRFNESTILNEIKYINISSREIGFDEENRVFMAGHITTNASTVCNTQLYKDPTGLGTQYSMFLAGLDSDKNCNWVKQSYGGQCTASHISCNDEHIYANIHTDTCLVFDSVELCSVPGLSTSLLCMLSKTGDLIWSTSYSFGSGYAYFTDTEVDKNGNCYVGGWFTDTMHIGNHSLRKEQGANSSSFIAKYDTSANILWLTQLRVSEGTGQPKLSTDRNGYTYATGSYSGTLTIGNHMVVAEGEGEYYIARIDPMGNCIGIKTVNVDEITDITQDSIGNAIVVGRTDSGTVHMDNIALTGNNDRDFFIAKLGAITTGINSLKQEDGVLNIFANPSQGNFVIEVPQSYTGNRNRLQIADSEGRLVKDELVEVTDNTIQVALGEVSKGVYTVVLGSGKKSYTGRVVIK